MVCNYTMGVVTNNGVWGYRCGLLEMYGVVCNYTMGVVTNNGVLGI